MPATPKVTFIHSLFRGGSTYFFEAIRRSSIGHVCFSEPFHEIVLKYEDDPTQLIRDRTDSDDSRYRHPRLLAPYFAELVKAWPSWVGKLAPSDIYQNYFRVAGQDFGQKYWNALAESTPKPVIFKETRTSGRIGAIKYYFPESFGAYLLRNPWDQWFSYKSTPYFDATVQAIINSESRPAACRYVAGHLGLIKPDTSNIFDEIGYYQSHRLAPADSYIAFFMIWCLALLEASEHSDIIVKMDRLNHDCKYRSVIQGKFADAGINVDLSDCCLPKNIYTAKDREFFAPHEELVFQILSDSGWTDEHVSLVKTKRDASIEMVNDSANVDHKRLWLVSQSSAALRSLYFETASRAAELDHWMLSQASERDKEIARLQETVADLEKKLAIAKALRSEECLKLSGTLERIKKISGQGIANALPYQ
jgi:hypothetical protein